MALSPSRMDISSALQVLRDAKLDALWEHRQEIEITLSNISRRLRVSMAPVAFHTPSNGIILVNQSVNEL